MYRRFLRRARRGANVMIRPGLLGKDFPSCSLSREHLTDLEATED